MSLRDTDPAAWMAEMLKEREEAMYAEDKKIVRQLLITHGAEDLIPMLLED